MRLSRKIFPFLLSCFAVLSFAQEEAGVASHAAKELARIDAEIAAAKKADPNAVVPYTPFVGSDSKWIFPPSELRHLSKGAYWEKWDDLGLTDPVPEITRYAKEIEALGATLVLVPVPAKATLYPEEFAGKGAVAISAAPFLKKLSAAGVEIVDVEALLLAAKQKGIKVYCEQDSHWSPVAGQIVAAELAKTYGKLVPGGAPEGFARSAEGLLPVHGDLVTDDKKESLEKEELKVVYAGKKGEGARPDLVAEDQDSPVLIIGDSHTLVFSEGASTGMHCQGAGLTDHLAAELGLAVDLHANKGSGGNTARGDVARRAYKEKEAFWGKKKLVIWCFSIREFTEGTWKKVPAQP